DIVGWHIRSPCNCTRGNLRYSKVRLDSPYKSLCRPRNWRGANYSHRDTMERDIGVTTIQEDDMIREFLVDHFKDDILEINPQNGSIGSLRLRQSLFIDPKQVRKSIDIENGDGNRGQVTMKLSLAALSRMRMRKLQIELTHRILKMHYLEELPDDWEQLLEKYIIATRDNDYIRTCVDRGFHDPFLIRSERKVDSAILEEALLQLPTEKLDRRLFTRNRRGKLKFNLAPPLEEEPTAIGGTRTEMTQKQRTEEFLKRIVVSVIGGAFLVVPVWIMVLIKSTYTSLITTTAFVFVGGFAAAGVLKDNLQVVSVTAAYAAVLVVFVGANGSST
ncbi:hypothetical protein F4774DRAFT_428560, partial [Daldinia eschscholtzii]